MKAKTIEKKNKQVRRLTKAQKAVAIAKDVLAQIKVRRIIISPGKWVEKNTGWCSQERFDDSPKINKTTLTEKNTRRTCSACALGAAMVSSIRLFNEFDDHYVGPKEVFNQLSDVFSTDQQQKIEIAFEGRNGYFGYEKDFWGVPIKRNDQDAETMEKILAFKERHPNKNKRAIAIFRNIIRNQGTFIP